MAIAGVLCDYHAIKTNMLVARMGFKPGRISQATAFAMSGFGAPVRSEIGPYQPLTQCASRLKIRKSLAFGAAMPR